MTPSVLEQSVDVVCRVCLGETDGFELLLQDGNYKVVAVDCLSMIEGVIQDAGLEWIQNSRRALRRAMTV